jgi:hypothetical protein
VLEKYLFEAGNDGGEPIAWIWHRGNDPIGHRTNAVVDLVDGYLLETHVISLVHPNIYMITILLTVLTLMIIWLRTLIFAQPSTMVPMLMFRYGWWRGSR